MLRGGVFTIRTGIVIMIILRRGAVIAELVHISELTLVGNVIILLRIGASALSLPAVLGGVPVFAIAKLMSSYGDFQHLLSSICLGQFDLSSTSVSPSSIPPFTAVPVLELAFLKRRSA